jgi:5'-3' exonuclease
MLLLIDYSSMLYRAYHSSPSTIPMHGVHGLLGMLARVISERKPDQLALATDEDWRPAFRVARLPMYKAQRVSEVPDPVLPHEGYGRKVLHALGLCVVGLAGYEAEDVIATLAERSQDKVEILSGDRDLFDLVRDPRVKVLYPQKGGTAIVDEAWIADRYKVPGRRYGDFALLRGDPSDNLPGVPGIGEKTAQRLISDHGSVKAVMLSKTLPAPLRKKLVAAQEYIEAARAVMFPVRDLPLPKVAMELPKKVRDAAFLQQASEEHNLGGSITRLCAALGFEA